MYYLIGKLYEHDKERENDWMFKKDIVKNAYQTFNIQQKIFFMVYDIYESISFLPNGHFF